MRHVAIGHILLLLLFVWALPVRAQDTSSGAVRGAVLDPQGSRIAGASIALVNSGTGFRYSTVTNSEGRFAFDLLPPGDYAARATVAGMSPQLTPQLQVAVGATLEVEFNLTLAGTQETVTVSAAPQLVETQPSAVSALVDERAISELPLNGRRYTDLALLTPGVTQDPRGLTSGSNGDLAFGGMRGSQTSYLVDGADNNNAFYAQARGGYRAPYQFSNEVVQEFRVSATTYSSDLGRSGGAVVNVVTKSGSNQVHGPAFFSMRDSSMAATPGFMPFKPHSQQQQFGFTLGGPIRRNRAFFFAGWDQHIFHIPTVVHFSDGSFAVTPQAGQGPLADGDYEDSDKIQVFAAANRLDALAGQFPAKLLGNAGFAKLDLALTPRNALSARLSTSRFFGSNNVYFDPGSPLTTFAMSDNVTQNVATETGSLSLTSGLSPRWISHLRAQFSRDLQQSFANSTMPLTKISSIIDGFGEAAILPRSTREHRLHLTETISFDGAHNTLKFGGDALFTWIYNYFPSQAGGEYLFDPVKVNPFTFAPMEGGLELTPLRAYAHGVPKYYEQKFGSFQNHPDTNEYAAFLQDTIRIGDRLAISLGGRYDLQTFTTKGLTQNPLWPQAGRVPFDPYNFAPRAGFAYSLGNKHPLVMRGGYGLFFARIPQIYNSTLAMDNGITNASLFLNASNYYANQVFPHYPYPLVSCTPGAASCLAPPGLQQFLQADVAGFASNFRTPHVEQASMSLEHEIANRTVVAVSYTYVHGESLIRARDVNLPPPVDVSYPVYDSQGINFLGAYYDVPSFSTWQQTPSFTCPYPPCINPLARPIPQLGAVDQFESAASSIYNGASLSIRRQMTHGVYFNLAYTFAHAEDDGQDSLVAGQPAAVQNAAAPNSERGNSTTDQRQRFVFSWAVAPKPFGRGQDFLSKIFNNWKSSGVVTVGSGRPFNVLVSGDPNQDGNSLNDRLPGVSRNSLIGPTYATTDMRVSRYFHLSERVRLELLADSFNLLNRDNKRYETGEQGFQSTSVQFIKIGKQLGINYFPAYFQSPASPAKANAAFAPRQLQFGMKLIY